jgi:hypothetical protein
MKKQFLPRLLLVGLLAGAANAHADFFFRANLTHEQETPLGAVPNEGTKGFATFVLNDAMTQLTYFLDTSGLDFRGITTSGPLKGVSGNPIPGDDGISNNVTRIHIHSAPPGVAGGIVFGQVELPNNGPGGASSIGPCVGICTPPVSDTLNDEDDLAVNVANGIITGVWDATEGANNNPANFLTARLTDLFAGNLYLNVHTPDHPGGEIRGQIIQAVSLPEPGTLALLACALGGIYLVMRRKAATLRV